MYKQNFEHIMGLVTDAVVLVNTRGEQVAANPAGRDLVGESGPRVAPLLKIIKRVQSGEIALPCQVKPGEVLAEPQPEPESLWLLAGPTDDGPLADKDLFFVLIAPRPGDPLALSHRDTALLDLVGTETRRDLSRMVELLRNFDQSPANRRETLRLAEMLAEEIEKLGELVDLQQRVGLSGQERIFLGPVVEHLIKSIEQKSPALPSRFSVSVINAEPSPIYGQVQLLGRALKALLTQLAKACPASGRITISIQQLGDFVLINGKVIAGNKLIPTRVAEPSSTALTRRDLQIARRIVELHGGQVRLGAHKQASDEADTPVESFLLSLPTCRPAVDKPSNYCAACPTTFQAQQYAKDLAEVMGSEKAFLMETRS